MRKYIGPDYVPGVPCEDFTEERWQELIDSGQIEEGSPAAANWEKEKTAGKGKGSSSSSAASSSSGASAGADDSNGGDA